MEDLFTPVMVSGIISLIFAFVGIGIIQRYASRVKKELKNYARPSETPSYDHGFGNKINRLSQDMDELRLEIKLLKSKNIPLEITNMQPVEPVTVPEPATVKEVSLFLPTPEADGSFLLSSLSPVYKEGASIYRMTKVAEDKASFQLENSPIAVRLALQYPELRIAPCCDATNAYDASATGIRLERTGLLELREDKWIVNTKALISYEN